MQNYRKSRAILQGCALILASMLALAPLPGCGAGGLAAVVTAVNVIAQIADLVGTVEQHVSAASADGLVPPEVAERIAAVRRALDVVRDASERGPAAYEIAVAEFERVWAELAKVVRPFGVVAGELQGDRLSAHHGPTLEVASGEQLGAALRRGDQ